MRVLSEETKKKISETLKKGYRENPERVTQLSESLREWHSSNPELAVNTSERMKRVRPNGVAVTHRWTDSDGYVSLSGIYDHSLSASNGEILEARFVLFNSIGEGPHSCHWSGVSGCGREELYWTHESKELRITTDHLELPKSDNRLENLVVSCYLCNWNRENPNCWWAKSL